MGICPGHGDRPWHRLAPRSVAARARVRERRSNGQDGFHPPTCFVGGRLSSLCGTSGRGVARAPSTRRCREPELEGAAAIQRAGWSSSSDLLRRGTAFFTPVARAVAELRGHLRRVAAASPSSRAQRRSNGQDGFHPPTCFVGDGFHHLVARAVAELRGHPRPVAAASPSSRARRRSNGQDGLHPPTCFVGGRLFSSRGTSGRGVARAPSTRCCREPELEGAAAIQRAGWFSSSDLLRGGRLSSPRGTSGRGVARAPSTRCCREAELEGAAAIQRAGWFSSSDLLRRGSYRRRFTQ
jgi:hypothetical protein